MRGAPDTSPVSAAPIARFSRRLLAWYDAHGRKDLPWQLDPTPYRVWVSEIMLQQTQVATVRDYYPRFMARFPDLDALAGASLDEVLQRWSGLGYYARARNLHRAAQLIRERHGEFPAEFAAVAALPGVGRSTAGAILALALNQRHPILDGNVKRVLTRLHAIAGWPGQRGIEQQLWQLAQDYTPRARVRDHTQAIMDLGATLCTRARPGCAACPFEPDCEARRLGRPQDYPAPKPRAHLPERQATFLMICNAKGEVLLEQRPPAGIWGGLWSLPECPADEQIEAWVRRFGIAAREIEPWPMVRHTFSHFHLLIRPVRVAAVLAGRRVMEQSGIVWYNAESIESAALAAPVRRLLERLGRQQATPKITIQGA